MTKDFISVLPTSVPNEKAFSKAGVVITTRLARLQDRGLAGERRERRAGFDVLDHGRARPDFGVGEPPAASP